MQIVCHCEPPNSSDNFPSVHADKFVTNSQSMYHDVFTCAEVTTFRPKLKPSQIEEHKKCHRAMLGSSSKALHLNVKFKEVDTSFFSF